MFPSGEDGDDVPEPERKPMRGIFIGCWAAPIDTFARNKVASCSPMKTFLFMNSSFPISYCLLHRITLSARANTLGGIVSPICLAVFRLMMNSKFGRCRPACKFA